MAELKATIRISENPDGGWQYEVDDGHGEPYAMGTHADLVGTWEYAFPYVHDLAYEQFVAEETWTPEEYAAEVARAKVEFQKKQIVPRSGVR